MQISKFWAVACSAIICASQTRSGAVDNEAQKKAREALENQVNSQPVQVAPAPVAPAPVPPKPKKPKKEKPAPVPRAETPSPAVPSSDTAPIGRPLAVPSQPIPPAPRPVFPQRELKAPATEPGLARPTRSQPAAPTRADSETIAKAREAMRQKMTEVQTQNPALVAEPEPVPARGARPMRERPEVKPEPAPSEVVVKHNPPSAPKKSKKKMEPATNLETSPDNANVNNNPGAGVTVGETAPAQATTSQPGSQAPTKTRREQKQERGVSASNPNRYPAIEGPPSSLSSSKQQKLDELLQRYRADEVTPEQYHTERAKIINEP